jgi:conserved hypothetical integral membrane protein
MSNNNNPQRQLSVAFVTLAIAFAVCLIVSNIFVPRTWKVWSLPLQLTGGVVIFPVSYIINDCLTEVYGYRKTRLVIWITFALSFFIALTSQLVTMLPDPMYPESQPVADSFDMLFSMVPRTTLASLMAFICGSTVNAWIMSRMKVATSGKGFGWRAVISSLGGEMVDSLVFFPIVFLGTMPIKGIVTIMLTQVVVKTLYEIVILPVTRCTVKRLKKIDGIDTYDENISYNPFRINDI